MKIKIIVEGRSDEIFLKHLIRKHNLKKINIEISGGKNKCEITKHTTIRRLLQNAQEDGYDKIIILVDKKTQFDCKVMHSNCLLDVKREYKNRVLKNLNADIIIVDEEIECWFILGEAISNYQKNCLNEAKKLFKTNAKQQLAQRASKNIDSILSNRKNNKSFDYFLKKIGI